MAVIAYHSSSITYLIKIRAKISMQGIFLIIYYSQLLFVVPDIFLLYLSSTIIPAINSMRLSVKPCLLSLSCLIVMSFPVRQAAAQQPLKQVNSTELITEGVKLHDKGEYKKAMALYRQVPEGDTNYILAVNELLVSS